MPWKELKELEEKLDVRITSRLAEDDKKLVWRVTMKKRQNGKSVTVERPEISEAVAEGIRLAKEAGISD